MRTTFTIYLRRHAGKAERAPSGDVAARAPHGHETTLVVEDEAAILMVATRLLDRQGYTVQDASTPGEAIRIAKEHTGEIHLLITDVITPEMNGRVLPKHLLAVGNPIQHGRGQDRGSRSRVSLRRRPSGPSDGTSPDPHFPPRTAGPQRLALLNAQHLSRVLVPPPRQESRRIVGDFVRREEQEVHEWPDDIPPFRDPFGTRHRGMEDEACDIFRFPALHPASLNRWRACPRTGAARWLPTLRTLSPT